MANRLKIRQVRSAARRKENQNRTLRALGIRHLQQEVEHADTPQIRGMIDTIRHLLVVEEVGA